MYFDLNSKVFKNEQGEEVVDLTTAEKEDGKSELEYYEDLLGF